MEIQRIEAYPVALRYREPFRIAPSVSTESRNVVVKIQTDHELTGVGEASPSERVTQETQSTILQTLDRICPSLIGMTPLRIERIIESMENIVAGNPSAKAAVDMALHDVLGKKAQCPLFKLLGGFRDRVLTDLTLSVKESEEMAKDATRAVDRGFRALKVKVGLDPEEDLERIRMVRASVDADIALRIDANQGWTLQEAIKTLAKLEAFDIELVEQPIAAEDVKGLRQLRKASAIPIMADESVHAPSDAMHLIKEEAVDSINIKLMKCVGLWNGKKIASVAEAAHVPCMIGCMGESAIGISAGVHLAAALRNIEYADLDSDLLLKDKLVQQGGAELKASERIPPDHPGLGILTLDERLLGKPARVYQ